MASEQVVLLGLDGLGWDEIGDWVEEGTLSTLQSLREEGTGTTLTSTHPPWTPCAWPSLLSGHNPGRHGVFDFFTLEEYDKRLVDRRDVASPYLYEVADAQGLVPVVVNYPVTHPATKLEEGAVVPGYLAPEDVAFHPLEVRDEYEAEYGPYRLYPDYSADEDAVAEYVSVARCRRDMTRLLDDRYDWDLLAVQFQVTDSVFHALDDREEVRRVLAKVDEFAGDIIDLADDDATVFVVSDHGMGDYSWTFYVNSWLADNGYCETTAGETRYFPQVKSKLKTDRTAPDRTGPDDTTGPNSGQSSVSTRAVRATADVLSALGLSPRQVHRSLARVGLDTVVESLVPHEALLEAQNQTVDYPNSTAFQLLFNSFGVHLNVEGRNVEGQIPPDQYDAVRDRLITDLSSVRDPDGKPVFESVEPRESVYEGANVERAPDVIVTPRDHQYDVSGTLVDTFRRNQHKNHKPEGLLVTNQELTDAESDTETSPSIYDVAPTVGAALGLPADLKADGRVLSPFSSSSEVVDWEEIRQPILTSDSSGEAGDVESHLADLGYLE